MIKNKKDRMKRINSKTKIINNSNCHYNHNYNNKSKSSPISALVKTVIFSILILLTLNINFATIVGVTTTTDNGVLRVTTDNNVPANSIIDKETVVITGAGTIQGDIDITQSQLKFYNVNTQNDANAPFTNGARGTTAAQTRVMEASSLTFQTTAARHNIFISELSGGSEIIETGNLLSLFVYSQPGAIIKDAIFRNIKVHEVYSAFAEFFDVAYIDTQIGQLNWEAGRLDRYSIYIPSTTSNWYSWIGGGNGGNNQFWDWNPKSIDPTRIIHENTNNRYYLGYTASYNFLDKFTSNPVSDVLVILKDDRSNIGGVLNEISRYTTDGTGILTGTIDSKDLSVGANQQRPTLYSLKKQSRLTGGTSATAAGLPNSYNYVIDDITSELEIKSYMHLQNSKTFDLTKEVGKLSSDLSVEEYYSYLLTPDSGISQTNIATVLSYTELDNLEKFYDRAKAEWRTNDDFPIFETSGDQIINLDNVNLIINSTAGSVYDYNSGTNTVTIKASQFMTTSKFQKIITGGTITIDPSVLSDLDTSLVIPVNLTITGLPTTAGANALCKFIDMSDSSSQTLNEIGGEITINTISGKVFNVVCDAIGYERSNYYTLSTGSFGTSQQITLNRLKDREGFNLYGFGNPTQKTLITYDNTAKKIYVKYSTGEPIITYHSYIDKLEEIFSSSGGIDYNIEYTFVDGKIKIDSGSFLKLSPNPTNTADPENNFVTYIENDNNPHAPYDTIGSLKIIYPTIDTLNEFDEERNYTLIMDEIKILNVALTDEDALKLYKDQLYYLKLDATVTNFNRTSGDLDIDVTFPFIERNHPMTYHFYYNEK